MKKYLLSLITLTLLLCEAFFTGSTAFAADFGTNLTYTISSNTLTISVKSGKTEGTMPYWTSSNYTNATTGRPWESSKTTITTVIINKGVKNIGSYAFNGFTALATVKFGTSTTDTCSLDSIGTAAFTACSAVANVYCWESNGTRALAHWLSIGMANTTSNPFCASTAATKRFYMQSSNTTTITIPSGTKKVKPYAFYKTPATTIKFPSSVKYIGTYAVANSTTLKDIYFGTGSTDLCGVDTIMGYAFTGCTAIANVYCYGGIGKYLAIGMNSSSSSPFYASTAATKKFYLEGTSTTTITIPEGATRIKQYAFYKHSYLTKVSLPSTITSVGTYAFAYCTGLTDFVALPAAPPSTTSYTFNNTTIASINLYVASSAAKSEYEVADRWKDFATRSTTFSGNCGASGDNITFVLNFAEHSLTLTGSGAMATYSTSTKAPWYTFKDDINTITIGSGITGIGAYAFKDCANVTSASLPASITSIGSSAFDGCKAMTSYSYAGTIAQWLGITFSGSSSNPMYYVKKCFVNGSTEINNLVIPDETTAIGNYAFYNCSGLTAVTLPASLTSVGTAAFSTCTNIANTNFLGSIDQWCGITFAANISNPAFFSKQLSINGVEQTDIYLSDYLSEIKNYVFQANAALTSISVKNTTTIQSDALTDCNADLIVRGELSADFGTGLHWTLSDGALTITKLSGTGAMPTFSSGKAPWYPYRKSVSKVIVDEGITQLGGENFQNFTNSCGVYLPSTLTQLANWAFDASTGINYIVCAATTPPTVIDAMSGSSSYSSNTFNGVPTTAYIYVPSGSESSYASAVTSSHSTASGWKRFSTFVPCITFSGTCGATGNETNVTWEYDPADKSLTISGTGAMADFASTTAAPWNGLKTVIASLSVANGITTIGKYAFYGCTAITAVNDLPSSLTSIGYHSFENCTSLTSFTVPQNVTKAGDSMLTGCGSLSTVVWNAENCTKVLKSDGQDIAMSTAWNPFCGMTVRNAITSFTFGPNVKTIPNGLCYNMSNASFTSVTIPAGVTSIGTNVFQGCSNLHTINWNATNCSDFTSSTAPFESIKTAITSFNFGHGVRHIPAYLCKDMNNITFPYSSTYGVTIPTSVKSIGTDAFDGCTQYNRIDYKASNSYALTYVDDWGQINFANEKANPLYYAGHLYVVIPPSGQSTPGPGEVKTPVFKDTTTHINPYAFVNCTNITSVTFGSAMSSIAANAFDGCTGITEVHSKATSVPTLSSSAFPAAVKSSAKLYLPHSIAVKASYRADENWDDFTEANTFPKIVQFSLNGKSGDAIDPQYFDDLTSEASVPSEPSVSYYTFDGWYENEGCTGSAYDFSTEVTADKILYAKWTLNDLELDEDNNNNSLIAAYDGQTTNVTMTRSLTNAQYNTFCLPFSLDASQMATAFGAGYDLEELTDATYDDGTITLTFTQRDALIAGKPYLLQPANNVSNPSFENVTISDDEPSDGLINHTIIEFHGVYSPTLLASSENLLFLGAGNELFWPEAAGNIKGFRAYFEVKGPALSAVRARLIVGKGETQSIKEVNLQSPATNSKYIKDGMLFIERDGKTYNAQGMLVE